MVLELYVVARLYFYSPSI